ncbi:hypothetical protein [Microvirga roseola]|uniref:hypothetical protein n=1 Tax=Microvirga roseola TaxID=2883126 RepID=UPI001E34F690|nr:hypothetical protein [Microvirga roseola]
MPVLDAKALDLDPKGAAFLRGVLRDYPAPKAKAREVLKIGRVHFHLRMIRRSKELLTDTV